MSSSRTVDRTVQAQIYRWAYRFLRNHHDALDATQEILLKWLRAGGHRIESKTAWLRRMTTNHCIDVLRRRQSAAKHEARMAEREKPHRTPEQQELQRAVAAGLEKLSDHQRAVIVAKVYDHETFAAIADSMGLSVSSVKTHYVRGLRALRNALRHEQGE